MEKLVKLLQDYKEEENTRYKNNSAGIKKEIRDLFKKLIDTLKN